MDNLRNFTNTIYGATTRQQVVFNICGGCNDAENYILTKTSNGKMYLESEKINGTYPIPGNIADYYYLHTGDNVEEIIYIPNGKINMDGKILTIDEIQDLCDKTDSYLCSLKEWPFK